MCPNPSDSRKAEVGDTGMAILVDQDVGLNTTASGTCKHPTTDHRIPLSDLRGRGEDHGCMTDHLRHHQATCVSQDPRCSNNVRTSFVRFTSGFF